MNKLILTADQIYAMAYIIDAKYLDYYYISLSNRENDKTLWRSEIKKKLVSEGVLVEDFSGDTTIPPDIEMLLKPLYFGTKESSIDILIFGENEDNLGYRFHYLDEMITMTRTVDSGLELSSVSMEGIKNIVSELLPSDYSAETKILDVHLDKDNISRVLVVKNIEKDVSSVTLTLIESEGVVYFEDSDNRILSISRTDFEDKLLAIITGD